MAIKVGGTTVINDSKKGIFETVNPGQYTTANRPSNPVEGDVIYDTDEKNIYVWNGVEWVPGGGGDFDPPVLFSNTLTQDQINGDRFTNNSFTSALNNTGGDATDCLMTATVTGALAIEAGTEPITTNAYPGTSSSQVDLTLAGTGNLGDGIFEVNDVVKANVSYTPTTSTILGKGSGLPLTVTQDQHYTDYVWERVWTAPEQAEGTTDSSRACYVYQQTSILTFNTPFSGEVRFLLRTGSSSTNGGFIVAEDADGAELGNITQMNDNTTGAGYRVINAANISTLRFVGNDPGMLIHGIALNGIPVLGGPNDVTLTLTDETDIALFETDDIVQRTGWDQSYTWSDYWDSPFGFDTYAFDNNSATRAYDPNQFHTWTAPYTIPVKKQLRVRSHTYSPGTTPANQIFEVNGVNYYNLLPEYVAGSTPWIVIPETELRTIKISGFGDGFEASVLGGVEVDGVELVDPSIPGNPGITAKVIATNVSAKTITVDGGNWDTTNQSEVWSESITNPGFWQADNPAYFAFDGNIETRAVGPDGATTFRPNTAIPITQSLEYVTKWGGTSGYSIRLSIDGVSQTIEGTTTGKFESFGDLVGKQIDSSTPLTVEWLRPDNSTANSTFSTLRVDGRVLVDAAEDSKVWSDQASGTFNVNGQPEKLFDGDNTTGIYSNSGSQGQIDLTGITGVTKLEAYWYTGSNGNWTINVGGQDVNINPAHPQNGGGSGTLQWVDMTYLFTTPFDLGTLKTSSTGEGYMSMLKVNDKFVLDPGVRNLGDSTVTTFVPKQGQGTISGINGAAVTITPFTDNCFKEGQHLVHATPKPVLVNPKTDVLNTIDGNNLTFASDKDLYQFADGDAVYMCDAAGNVASASFTTGTIQTVVNTSVTVGSPMENYNVVLSNGNSYLGPMTQEVWELLQADPNWNAINPDPNKVSPEPYFYITGTNRCRFQYTGADTTKDYFMLSDSGTGQTIYTFDLEGDIAPENGQVTQTGTQGRPNELKDKTTFKLTQVDGYFDIHLGGGGNFMMKYLSFGESTVLNFVSNANLEYFKDGDVVQEEFVSANKIEEPSNAVSDGAGDLDGNNGTACVQRNTGRIVYQLVKPTSASKVTVKASLKIENNATGGSFNVVINEGLSTESTFAIQSASANQVANYNTESITFGSPIAVETIAVYPATSPDNPGGNGVSVAILLIDDVALVQPALNSQATVVGTPTLDPPQMHVSGGTFNIGDTVSVTKSGAGTFESANVNTNTMVLKNDGTNNGQWISGYYVATAQKPASSTVGYVRFDSDGQVECIESYPLPATNMQNKGTPKLRFPDKFECVDAAPDSELGASTYLQTEVQLKNLFGDSAVKKSNVLIPQTSTYTVAANTASLNTTEYAESAAKIKTQSERAAQRAVDNTQQSLQDWQSDFTDEANNYSI